MAYLYLFAAIVFETLATAALQAAAQSGRAWLIAIVVGGYAIAFVFLALSLRSLPVGVAYAIWSGIGIILITAIGRLWFAQKLDTPALIGIGLIVAGVVTLKAFSSSAIAP